MANIRQYTSPNAESGLHPSDEGAAAWERAGRQIGASYHQEGQDIGAGVKQVGDAIEQHDTMAEMSKGAADMAALQDTLTTNWNNTAKSADPNNANLASDWREKQLEPAIAEWEGGFQTKQGQMWAMEQGDRMRQHLYEKTAADQSTLAGDALVSNLNALQVHASNIVRNDPSSVDAVHGMVDSAITATVNSTPNLSADVASKARTEIADKVHAEVAQSAVIGAADKNPDAARTMLNSPSVTDHLDGSQVKTLESYVDGQQRASIEAQKAEAAAQKAQDKQDYDGVVTQITAQTIQPDGSIKINPGYFTALTKAAFMPGAGDGSEIRSMINFGQEQVKRAAEGTPAITDPHVYADLKARATLPAGDPRALTLTDVYQAGANGQLSNHDFGFFKGWVSEAGKNPQKVADQKVLNQMEGGLKGFITNSNMLNAGDPQRNQRYMEFQQQMQMRFDAGRADGKTAAQLISPASPDYIAKDINRFQISGQQSMDATITSTQGNVQPLAPVGGALVKWKPGMSMDDLHKALNGGK